MGTVAATVTRDQLAAGPLTHAVLNRAMTAGFSSAFEVAGVFALAGFVAALVAVRHRPAPAATSQKMNIAA
jgi:hypothetical protein